MLESAESEQMTAMLRGPLVVSESWFFMTVFGSVLRRYDNPAVKGILHIAEIIQGAQAVSHSPVSAVTQTLSNNS